MHKRTLLLVSLLLAPSILAAQKGSSSGGKTRGDKKADWDGIEQGMGAGLQLGNKDVENINPIKLLIDKRKDLKLSDAQTKQFKDFEGQLNERNDPFFKSLDSLRGVLKAPKGKGDLSDEDRARFTLARMAVGETVSAIRENYDSTAKVAIAILDASQQKQANEFVDNQRTEAEDMLREKLGGGGGGAAAGAKGRGRPPMT